MCASGWGWMHMGWVCNCATASSPSGVICKWGWCQSAPCSPGPRKSTPASQHRTTSGKVVSLSGTGFSPSVSQSPCLLFLKTSFKIHLFLSGVILLFFFFFFSSSGGYYDGRRLWWGLDTLLTQDSHLSCNRHALWLVSKTAVERTLHTEILYISVTECSLLCEQSAYTGVNSVPLWGVYVTLFLSPLLPNSSAVFWALCIHPSETGFPENLTPLELLFFLFLFFLSFLFFLMFSGAIYLLILKHSLYEAFTEGLSFY